VSDRTKIEWAEASWNPIRARHKQTGKVGWHCTKPSAGCSHCYAESMNKRLGTGLPYSVPATDLVDIFVDGKALTQPFGWKKPRRIFVCSMTDLFGEFVTDAMIDRVFAVMALLPRHQFLLLTKRAKRMLDFCSSDATLGRFVQLVEEIRSRIEGVSLSWSYQQDGLRGIRLPNVWLGVSAENQATADERIPLLLQTPAAVRFVSYEPALGPLSLDWSWVSRGSPRGGGPQVNMLRPWEEAAPKPGLDWIIIGGESGHDARPFDIEWARRVLEQCKAANVPAFMKQVGSQPFWNVSYSEKAGPLSGQMNVRNRKGGEPSEWPEDLRVREFPTAAQAEKADANVLG